jgi:hypothetical protein
MRSQNSKVQLSKHWQPSMTGGPPLSGVFFQQVTLTKRRAPAHAYSSCTTGTLIELYRNTQGHSSIIAGVMAEDEDAVTGPEREVRYENETGCRLHYSGDQITTQPLRAVSTNRMIYNVLQPNINQYGNFYCHIKPLGLKKLPGTLWPL